MLIVEAILLVAFVVLEYHSGYCHTLSRPYSPLFGFGVRPDNEFDCQLYLAFTVMTEYARVQDDAPGVSPKRLSR